jgi:hypothetical protein
MPVSEAEPALRWRCPVCSLEWIALGAGFPGHRFSGCLRCGAHAREASDATPASAPAPAERQRRSSMT